MRFGFFQPPPATRALMLAMTIIPFVQWLLLNGFHLDTAQWTVMDAGAVLQGQLWRPVTYLFTYGLVFSDWNTTLHWAFSVLMVWSFGTGFEPEMGPTRLLKLFFGCGLAGALSLLSAHFFLVPDLTGLGMAAGSDASIIGMAMAFSFIHADEVIRFLLFLLVPVQMQGRYLGPIMAVLFWAGARTPPVLILSAILASWLMIRKGFWLEASRFQRQPKKKKSRLQFVAPSSQKVTPIRPDPQLFRQLGPEDNEVDRILDKLRDEGMTALSPEERATLDAHSRKLRHRDGL